MSGALARTNLCHGLAILAMIAEYLSDPLTNLISWFGEVHGAIWSIEAAET